MVTFVPGRLPPHPEDTHPRLKLGRYLTAAAPTSVDWYSQIAAWPLYDNDRYGDCVEAEMGHHEQALSLYGSGMQVRVADDAVLRAYEDIAGFRPDDPSTDRGTNIQDALGYWRKTGIVSHKIAAFAELNVGDVAEVKAAVAQLGPVSIGINLPASAEDQFNAGQPWNVVADDGGILGGHCVCLVGFDAQFFYVVTWGAVQKMTVGFWRRYVEEAWAVLSREWVGSSGVDPEGVDLQALGEAFTRLTGQASPFPVQPVPVPAPPSPGPDPKPVDEADQVLAAAAHQWLTHRHVGANGALAKQLQSWLVSKGL